MRKNVGCSLFLAVSPQDEEVGTFCFFCSSDIHSAHPTLSNVLNYCGYKKKSDQIWANLPKSRRIKKTGTMFSRRFSICLFGDPILGSYVRLTNLIASSYYYSISWESIKLKTTWSSTVIAARNNRENRKYICPVSGEIIVFF